MTDCSISLLFESFFVGFNTTPRKRTRGGEAVELSRILVRLLRSGFITHITRVSFDIDSQS